MNTMSEKNVLADFLNCTAVVFHCIVDGFTFQHLVGLFDGIDDCPFCNLPCSAQEVYFRGGELAGSRSYPLPDKSPYGLLTCQKKKVPSANKSENVL